MSDNHQILNVELDMPKPGDQGETCASPLGKLDPSSEAFAKAQLKQSRFPR